MQDAKRGWFFILEWVLFACVAFVLISCAGKPSVKTNQSTLEPFGGELPLATRRVVTLHARSSQKTLAAPARSKSGSLKNLTSINSENLSASEHSIYKFLDKVLDRASLEKHAVEVVFLDQLSGDGSKELSSIVLACGAASTSVSGLRRVGRSSSFEMLSYTDKNRDALFLDSPEQVLLHDCKKSFEACKIKLSEGEWLRWKHWGDYRQPQKNLGLRGSSLETVDASRDASGFLGEVVRSRIAALKEKGIVLTYENSTFRAQAKGDRFEVELNGLQGSPLGFLLLGGRKYRASEIYLLKLDLWPGKHKPVTGAFVRRHYDSREEVGDWMVLQRYQDVAVYSNHYFDLWFRMLFLIEKHQRRYGLVCSVLDIDEIKGSGLKRFVFGKDLKQSIEQALRDELQAYF